MDLLAPAMFAAGLASGAHCVAMCGGIVTAFDAGSRSVIPIRPVQPAGGAARRFAFNAGRISSYAAAGAAVSLLGAATYSAGMLPGQQALGIAAAVVMLLMGLYLLGFARVLEPLERIGAPLWRRLSPLAARLLPARSWGQAYAAGVVWGFLPCAMVYAALGAAAFAGDPAQGALAMLAFGLGTLPFLLAAGWLAARIRAWRAAAGAVLLGFGAVGLAHAGALGEDIRRGLLCF
jgi:sulfite exporter TauE/SafE